MRRYQIIIKETKPGAKWEFIAHGARYERIEALYAIDRYKARGFETKLLPVN